VDPVVTGAKFEESIINILSILGGTLPETNSSHLKMVVSNRNLRTSRGLFSGAMLVSGRVTFTVEHPQKGRLYYTKPIGSMGLVYLPTFDHTNEIGV